MNKEIRISAEREYSALFVESWRSEFSKAKQNYARNLIFAPLSLKEVFSLEDLIGTADRIVYLPDGEDSKNFETIQRMWSAASETDIKRTDAIWGIGGGATTDSTGFAAATWLRGVSWHAIPTTLAGMVDAAVGGKTGINSPAGKNLIGSFHSPTSVIIDVSLLDTLSDRDFAAGLAEIIKTGFISDVRILDLLADVSDISGVRLVAADLINRSVQVKADVVSQDFKESKLREILNYGHTLGHAVEKRESYNLRHGEAVAIGLVFAAELSQIVLGLNPVVVEEHRQLLLKFGLPTTYPESAWDEILSLMSGDKKSRDGGLRFIGLSDRGHPAWIESVSQDDLKNAYGRMSS